MATRASRCRAVLLAASLVASAHAQSSAAQSSAAQSSAAQSPMAQPGSIPTALGAPARLGDLFDSPGKRSPAVGPLSRVELYLVDASAGLAQAMDHVVERLSAQAGHAIAPVLKPAGEFARSKAALRLVATRAPERVPGLLVALSLSEPAQIRNRQSGRVLMRVTPDALLASLELVDGSPPTLVLQATSSADGAAVVAFVDQALDAGHAGRLVDRVVIGDGDELVTLRFGPGGVEARSERMTWWERYVLQYRASWFMLLATIIGGLLLLTWKRLGRPLPAHALPAP